MALAIYVGTGLHFTYSTSISAACLWPEKAVEESPNPRVTAPMWEVGRCFRLAQIGPLWPSWVNLWMEDLSLPFSPSNYAFQIKVHSFQWAGACAWLELYTKRLREGKIHASIIILNFVVPFFLRVYLFCLERQIGFTQTDAMWWCNGETLTFLCFPYAFEPSQSFSTSSCNTSWITLHWIFKLSPNALKMLWGHSCIETFSDHVLS